MFQNRIALALFWRCITCYACMHVHICICICVCMCMCMLKYIHTHIYICIYVYVCVRVCACIATYDIGQAYIHLRSNNKYVYTYIFMHTYVHTYIHTYIYIYIDTYITIYSYIGTKEFLLFLQEPTNKSMLCSRTQCRHQAPSKSPLGPRLAKP